MNVVPPQQRTGRVAWNEADTCRNLITPTIQAEGWENEPHSIAGQQNFTDGRIIVRGNLLYAIGLKARNVKARPDGPGKRPPKITSAL